VTPPFDSSFDFKELLIRFHSKLSLILFGLIWRTVLATPKWIGPSCAVAPNVTQNKPPSLSLFTPSPVFNGSNFYKNSLSIMPEHYFFILFGLVWSRALIR
jgi:hypothetical protein